MQTKSQDLEGKGDDNLGFFDNLGIVYPEQQKQFEVIKCGWVWLGEIWSTVVKLFFRGGIGSQVHSDFLLYPSKKIFANLSVG